jgi:hypothetical protein
VYKVLVEFYDLQDGFYHYLPGDEYPRKGYEPSAERIAFLSGTDNVLHTSLLDKLVQKTSTRKKTKEKSE